MKTVFLTLSLLLIPMFAAAQDDIMTRWKADPTQVFDAAEVDLDALQWVARPIVVFAQTPEDPAFQRQMELLAQNADDLAERDVIIIADTDPAGRSDVRLQLRPRAFMFVLIGKDGQIKQRKPRPWNVREISRTIDKMPMRQQEIEERRSARQ